MKVYVLIEEIWKKETNIIGVYGNLATAQAEKECLETETNYWMYSYRIEDFLVEN